VARAAGSSYRIRVRKGKAVSSNSEAVTRGIRVKVQSRYLPERSQPDESQWLFIYQVRIANEGELPARLISRHWIITDGNGLVEEVKGEGVVGEQPLLEPGEFFEYTSGCPLKTPFGTMEGTYQMITSSGEAFDARIAPFSLAEPFAIN
jgi:ApaG protein